MDGNNGPAIAYPSPNPSSVSQTNGGSGGPQINSTVAIVLLSCIGTFLIIAIYKFYDVCRKAFLEQQRARERMAASWAGQRQYARNGLKIDQIQALPIRSYERICAGETQHPEMRHNSHQEEAEELEKECVVCLVEFEVGDKVKELPPCAHTFHVDCIDKWLGHSHTCPMCRVSLLSEDTPHQVHMVYRRSWWDVAEWLASGGGIWTVHLNRPRERYTVVSSVPGDSSSTQLLRGIGTGSLPGRSFLAETGWRRFQEELRHAIPPSGRTEWQSREVVRAANVSQNHHNHRESVHTRSDTSQRLGWPTLPIARGGTNHPSGATCPPTAAPPPGATYPLGAGPSAREPEFEASSNGDISIRFPAELLTREGSASLRDSDLSAILDHARSLSMATRDGGVVSDWDTVNGVDPLRDFNPPDCPDVSLAHQSGVQGRHTSENGASGGNESEPLEESKQNDIAHSVSDIRFDDRREYDGSGSSDLSRERLFDHSWAERAGPPLLDVSRTDWVTIDLSDGDDRNGVEEGSSSNADLESAGSVSTLIKESTDLPSPGMQVAETNFLSALVAGTWISRTQNVPLEMAERAPAARSIRS